MGAFRVADKHHRFAVIVIVTILVMVTTVPSFLMWLGASTPVALSPINVAGAQDTGTQDGSVAINKTESNQIQIELDTVTLPQNGFIVARSGNFLSNMSTEERTILGRTQYVRHGNFSDAVLSLNKTAQSGYVTVTIHNDTNGNEAWDGTKTDAAYTSADGTPVHDTIRLKNGSDRSQSQNTISNATVTFQNQTTNSSTVTVQSVTLSQPGFVTLHTSSYADGLVGPNESIIAVSQHLSAGTHQNVSINVSHAPPGNAPGLNRSKLNTTDTVAVAVYGDSNGNKRLDSVRSFGENDTLITHTDSVVSDTARVRASSPPRQTASVTLENQTLRKQNQNRPLVVEEVRLPDGGFVVAHNTSYQRGGDPLTSVVATSKYLEPGNYTNVRLNISPIYITRTQVVTIQPARDTNGNQRYDFVQSEGFEDVAYETLNHSDTIEDAARVRVPDSRQTMRPAPSDTPGQPAATGTATSPQATASSDVDGSNGLVGLSPLQLIAGGLVVLVIALYLIGKLR